MSGVYARALGYGSVRLDARGKSPRDRPSCAGGEGFTGRAHATALVGSSTEYGLGPDGQVAGLGPVNHVGAQPRLGHLQEAGQRLLDDAVAGPRPQVQVTQAEVLAAAVETDVEHGAVVEYLGHVLGPPLGLVARVGMLPVPTARRSAGGTEQRRAQVPKA